MKITIKNIITSIIIAITIILFFTLLIKTTENINCKEYENICIKTECTTFGCKKIEVDIDSPSCEIKIKNCKEWRLY